MDPRAIVRQEGLCQFKTPGTLSVIEPTNIRRHRGLQCTRNYGVSREEHFTFFLASIFCREMLRITYTVSQKYEGSLVVRTALDVATVLSRDLPNMHMGVCHHLVTQIFINSAA